VISPSSGYVPPYRRATIKGYFPADRSSRAPSVANSCVEIAEPTHQGKLMPGDLEPTYERSHDEKTKEPTGFPHSSPCHLNSEHSPLHANQNQCSSESRGLKLHFHKNLWYAHFSNRRDMQPLSIPYRSVLHRRGYLVITICRGANAFNCRGLLTLRPMLQMHFEEAMTSQRC
jgi:hypothetical protein